MPGNSRTLAGLLIYIYRVVAAFPKKFTTMTFKMSNEVASFHQTAADPRGVYVLDELVRI